MTTQSQSLSSTALSSATYDDETRTLDIGFRSGGSYTFANVPPEVYQALVGASSPGKYYHSYIKGIYG